jgi:hypothetical protein
MREVTYINPMLKEVNVNDLWYQALLIFCQNASSHYTRETGKVMTIDEVDAFTDAMKLILIDQNNKKVHNKIRDLMT